MSRYQYTILCYDVDILDMFLDYMYRKKYLKKILQKNDKYSPFYGRIELTISKEVLNSILKRRFNNQLIVR